MSMTNLVKKAVLASAVTVAAAGFSFAARAGEQNCANKQSCAGKDAAVGKEKCLGVVKAGKNDCASLNKTHSCAGQAKADGDANEWVYVPAGLCEKLAGGKVAG